MKNLDTMSIAELDKFGSEVQEKINTEMGSIISNYRLIDTGEAGSQLTELSMVANSATNKLARIGPLASIQRFMGKFDTVENKIDQIITGINTTKGKLDNVMVNMHTSRECIKNCIISFKPFEDELVAYISRLESEENCDELRRQSAVNRLKTLTTSRVVAEQSFVESTLLIGQTQEVQHQIDEMLTNIVPIFKMKLVNALSIKVHKEALELKAQVTKISEKLIIDNAKNIKRNTDIMIENRRSAVVNPDTLIEANEILQRVVGKAVEACATEADANKKVIERLNNASISLQSRAMLLTEETASGRNSTTQGIIN